MPVGAVRSARTLALHTKTPNSMTHYALHLACARHTVPCSVYTLLILCALLWCGCADSNSEPAAVTDAATLQATAPRQMVRVQPVRRGSFAVVRHATGLVRAARKVDIVAPRTGRILQLAVREGQRVRRGALIALIDTTELHFELRAARLKVEEAEYQKNDMLVMQGGKWGVDSSVSEAVRNNILIVSGLKQARETLHRLEHARQQCFVRAPFDGRIAEVQVTEGAIATSGKKLCVLLDASSYEAEFMLLEQEAVSVHPGMQVQVQPLALEAYNFRAHIHSINPVVNEEGLVRVRARIQENSRAATSLMEGMQVSVGIAQMLPDQLIIPRTAVVQRSARPVVFTYDTQSERAQWHYITIAAQNSEEVAIAEGLQADQLVIVEGNLTLDHDALVEVVDSLPQLAK